jgi:hypothetical protein
MMAASNSLSRVILSALHRSAATIKLYESNIFRYLSLNTYDNARYDNVQIIYHENTFLEASNSNAFEIRELPSPLTVCDLPVGVSVLTSS